MNPDLAGGSSLRRAALHLHAMGPADRDWLLARLAPARRERLEGLLQELRSLGIPADVQLPQAERPSEVQVPATAADRLDGISGEDVHWVAARLRAEPPQVAALLLSDRAWPWRQLLIEQLDPPRRECVEAMADAAGASLARAAILETLAQMLPARPPVAPHARGVRRWWRRK